MPDPPTEQQFHVMRQLRQLRHLEQTSRADMFIPGASEQMQIPWAEHDMRQIRKTPSPSLVELDIRDCDKFDMSPPDCEEMRLSFLSFDYQQVDYHDIAWLHHFVVHEQDSESMFKPFLRMECGEHTSQCDVQRWTVEAPFCLLTHLTICNAGEWPRVFDFLTDLHQLQVLDLRFLLEFCQISSPACSLETIVALNSTAKLTELYIAHGSYTKYDLAQCTTLSVLGLIQQKGKKPASHLPPYLTQLYLFNIVS